MANVENVEEIVGNREAEAAAAVATVYGGAMATESGGDETATRPAVPGTRPATRRRRRLMTNEMATTDEVMYADEGELEFDEDEMAALEGQRLVAEFRC